MNKAFLQTILQRPIAFHRVFVPLAGVTGALFLSQLLYWSDRGSEESGWIYKTQTEWTDETGLTRREQEFARRQLREAGVLEERYSGLPARLYYRIDFDALKAFIDEQVRATAEKPATKMCADVHPVATKPPSRPGAERQSTNTETTTEITAVAAVVIPAEKEQGAKQAAAAASVEAQIKSVKQCGAIIENDEDVLVITELLTEFGLEQVRAAINTIRHTDHRRAFTSNLRKKLTAKKALQRNELVIKQAYACELDAGAVEKGNNLLAEIARKAAARKSA